MNAFKKLPRKSLGLYPVIDSADWVEKLLLTGVKTLQLRIKNKNGIALEQEIKRSIALAKHYQATLFINDYWELAIQHGAGGVHLGQSDLDVANLQAIHSAGLYLGISTHNTAEVMRACALQPSYIACGPVFPTTSKIMPYTPQGIAQLKHWRATLDYPLVAIGGINEANIREVIETQVDGIAMISAITQAQDPIATTKKFLTTITEYDIKH